MLLKPLALLMLFVLLGLGLSPRDAFPAIVYRIGTPFSAVERDSLDGLGIDYREIAWSASQLESAVELDSLRAGSLQPNFFEQDEDIATTLLSRDGWIGIVTIMEACFCYWNRQIGVILVDEDPTTGYTWSAVSAESFDQAATRSTRGIGVLLDLGGRFLIREVRVRPLEGKPEQYLESVDLGVSDRGFATDWRTPDFPPIVQVFENTEPEIVMAFDPPVTTEAVQMRIFRDTPKEISLAAFEVYGGGFVSDASYESDVIELDDIASWGEIRWSGRRDPDARVEIRTRSGSDRHPEIFWEARPEKQDSIRFLQGGGDLTFTEYKRQYDRLSDVLKPIDEANWVTPDRTNWSTWSSPYAFEKPGAEIVSPSPRQFFQIRTDFASTIDDGGKLDYIEFKASVPPAVRRLVGEIYPTETTVGEATRFTYYVKPSIQSSDAGFDAVEISTPAGVVSVDALRIDEIDQGDFAWSLHEDGLGFEVVLPRRLGPADSDALVEVDFNAPVLREVGTVFAGRVFDTAKPHEVRQRILEGEAAAEIESERLSVTTSLSSSLVFSPLASPSPFTPNGDGINDVVTISYKLLRVTSSVPVSIKIFDLSGRLVRRVYAGNDPLGEYSHTWDGTDSAGQLVPSGIFLYRIDADLQSEREIDTGVVSVAY